MKQYGYNYLRNYLSAKGITLEFSPEFEKHKGKYRIGNELSDKWIYFENMDNVNLHIRRFF